MLLEHFLIVEVNESNMYLIACQETRQAALVDAAACDSSVIQFIQTHDFNLKYILVTHNHYDHTDGLTRLMAAFPNSEIIAGAKMSGYAKTRVVRDKESFQIGNLLCRALMLPGHTAEGVAYHIAPVGTDGQTTEPSVVFSGDALFAGSVGGTSSAATHEQEINGIRDKLFSLPDSTLIYPGHGPGTTVGIERRFNPFFQKPEWET